MIGPDDLLDFATYDLSAAKSEASARRAISAAYYALFHAVTQAAAALFAGPPELRLRLVRSFEHRAVGAMADEIKRRAGTKEPIDSRLVLVASNLKSLREAREAADYDLGATMSWVEAERHIVGVMEALVALNEIKADPAIAEFLLLPLLRDQKRRG